MSTFPNRPACFNLAVTLALFSPTGCSKATSKISTNELATVTATTEVKVADVQRFGVNLGTWTSWGAEQLSSNVIMNPGFEGMIDRAIVSVRNPLPGKFSDEGFWLARPDGFWEQATYEVRTGRNAGASGKIIRSRQKDNFSLPSFTTADRNLELDPSDVVSLTRTDDNGIPSQWWFSDRGGARYSPETKQTRPGSQGVRSLRVGAANNEPAEFASYLDAIGDRAGKLLPLEGKWRVSFWSRLDKGAANLRVMVRREGATPAMVEDVPLSRDWKRTEIVFDGRDSGPPWIASLRFYVTGAPNGEVLFDDVDFRRVEDTRSAFRREAVSALKALHPGYLRDWQGQLGDTLENRLAGAGARRVSRYRPGGIEQSDYHYSLPEFLDLAREVGASPWIVVPPPFTEAECGRLGQFLRDRNEVDKFADITVEFGNENWNPVFRPAGIPDAAPYGEAADRCFAALRATTGKLRIRTAVNAQHDNPASAMRLAGKVHGSDVLAVAPYFFRKLDAGAGFLKGESMLFSGDGGKLSQIVAGARRSNMEPAVYEVNLHTDDGSASAQDREPVTSGVASGAALAKTMLDALSLGIRRQCVYSLAGFDNRSRDGKTYVRLWGIVRDLADENHFRPTGLAVEMVNRALRGSMVRSESDDPRISFWAFRDGWKWSAVLVSSAAELRDVRILFPPRADVPTKYLVLDGDSRNATNEYGQHVTIQTGSVHLADGGATLAVPPFGLVVLVADEGEQ